MTVPIPRSRPRRRLVVVRLEPGTEDLAEALALVARHHGTEAAEHLAADLAHWRRLRGRFSWPDDIRLARVELGQWQATIDHLMATEEETR